MNFLNNAFTKTNSAKDFNKINFWKYLITLDKEILNQIADSNEIDFYSFIANELLEKNINSSNLLENIEEFNLLRNDPNIKKTALLYAISKVKSNFDERKISKDFKTGMFQLKPSLSKSLYTSINQDYTLEKLFKKDENITIAQVHFLNLEHKFSDVLELIEAFDGNAILDKKEFFNDNRKKFEPYFTLEILSNGTFEYQKEILLHYVIYYNSLTKKKKDQITLNSICQKLLEPHHKQGE